MTVSLGRVAGSACEGSGAVEAAVSGLVKGGVAARPRPRARPTRRSVAIAVSATSTRLVRLVTTASTYLNGGPPEIRAGESSAGEPVGSAISSSSSGVLLREAASSTHFPAASVAVAAPPHQR